MRIKSAVCFECYFRTIFGRFLSPKWAPKCAQKSLKHLPWGPQGPPRTPPAGRRPPGSTFGAFWNPFSTHLGAVLGCFGVLVLVVLVVLDCGCGRGGFASGCLRVGCSCGCSRPCFCQTTAGHEAPGEERVVGGVGEAIVNPPTTACGDERVWNR